MKAHLTFATKQEIALVQLAARLQTCSVYETRFRLLWSWPFHTYFLVVLLFGNNLLTLFYIYDSFLWCFLLTAPSITEAITINSSLKM